jgi:hypothetical protein
MKKIISLLLCTMMLISLLGCTVLATDNEISVYLNGDRLQFDVPPKIVDNRTMVPFRAIFEAFEMEVEWLNSDSATVTATAEWGLLMLQIGSNEMIVEGFYPPIRRIELDVPPMIVNNRTLVPLRAISESIGAEVDWDETTRTVSINHAYRGLAIIFQTELENPSMEQMETVMGMLRSRLESWRFRNSSVMPQGVNQIRIEIPGSVNSFREIEEMAHVIGLSSTISFIDSDGALIITGEDVELAEAVYDDSSVGDSREWYIKLVLTEAGRSLFSEATARIVLLPPPENQIMIMIDGEAISAPTVMERIDSKELVITGDFGFSQNEAEVLARLINAGRIEVQVTLVEISML